MTNTSHGLEPIQGFEFHHGDRLRKARDERGWTQEELADVSSVSKGSIQNYEAGKPMRRLQRRALALALGVSEGWIEHGFPCPRCESNTPPSAYMEDFYPFLTAA